MKKHILLAILVAGATALVNFAASSAHALSSVTGDGVTATETSGLPSSSTANKMAIIQGQEAAAAVLDGQPAGDLFANAKDAAEQVLNVRFNSDRAAALAIIELGESYK